MKWNHRIRTHSIWYVAFIISIVTGLHSCSNSYQLPNPLTHIPQNSARKNWLNFNVLFKSTSTPSERDSVMQIIIDSVVRLAGLHDSAYNQTDSVDVTDLFCPCDSLLHNVKADIPANATGTLVTTPTKPPGAKGAGDIVLLISENNLVSEKNSTYGIETPLPKTASYLPDTSKILAVMDTGLDTALFFNHFKDLLWSDKTGQITYRNFQSFSNGKGYDYYYDDNSIKHGSAVTTLALESARKSNTKNKRLPMVMVLKVLDTGMNGSTFTISCALSYARQKKATVVNASLGYIGQPDSVLLYYINLCNTKEDSIPIISAAGNIFAIPILPLCKPVTSLKENQLTNTRQFYPGCFSKKCSNVICVTGLQSVSEPCFYQNYSNEFVNVGVITNPSPLPSKLCCLFPIRFYNTVNPSGYEGSSFSTPVVSGQIIAAMVINHSLAWTSAYNTVGVTASAAPAVTPAAKKVLTYNSIP